MLKCSPVVVTGAHLSPNSELAWQGARFLSPAPCGYVAPQDMVWASDSMTTRWLGFLSPHPAHPPSGLRVLMTPVESLSFKAGSSSWLQGTCRPVTCPLSQKSRPLQSEYLGFFSSSAAALHGELFHLFEPHFAHLSNGTILIATGLLGRTDR